ncbi:Thymus-specific serine protease [Oryzias melastigma]|uniref:Thymus-specific serine protease n=1 Tax=Oryzias melastigma TaxID=30732 RepID=A0A834FL68_ORYME|nr:Thymus-specific serine protease [Oryzias melastigma]
MSEEQPLQQVEESWLEQPLDHFNRLKVKTFSQKFFVNEAHWDRPDGPVFLFIGGEGPIFKFDVLAGHHVEMAQQHRALLLAVEHRFYGDSINPDGLKTESLADLSSQQALADLAAFHGYICHKFNLTSRNLWVSFGGSYSGALSAWFRGKFPNLVYAAVASSAPVEAKLDFSAYNHVVGLSLKNTAVGGSEKCWAQVQLAFAAVEAELIAGNFSQLAADFSCCQIPQNLDDQIELMQNLAGVIMGAVQYNEEGVLMSISEICDLMTNISGEHTEMKPYSRLIKLAQIYRSSTEEKCLDVSHEKTIQDLMDTYYGGDEPHTHRVLYINGGIDPWKELSVVQGGGEVQSVFIDDTAHCADMSSRRFAKRDSLRKARQEIEKQVSDWLRTASLEKMD